MTISRERGRMLTLPGGGAAWITIHPSYLLRLPDEAAKADEFTRFVNDLKMVSKLSSAEIPLRIGTLLDRN
jgi:DNA polymerase